MFQPLHPVEKSGSWAWPLVSTFPAFPLCPILLLPKQTEHLLSQSASRKPKSSQNCTFYLQGLLTRPRGVAPLTRGLSVLINSSDKIPPLSPSLSSGILYMAASLKWERLKQSRWASTIYMSTRTQLSPKEKGKKNKHFYLMPFNQKRLPKPSFIEVTETQQGYKPWPISHSWG